VIKAYVDKQQRQPTKIASAPGKIEVSSLWTDASGAATETKGPDEDESRGDHLQAGRFLVNVGSKKAALAVAAPGVH
jgi:hypothetical protein